MPVAVNQPRAREKQEDPLDTIIKGLSIASSVYGIKTASDKQKLLEQERASKEAQQVKDNDFKTEELRIKDKEASRRAVQDPTVTELKQMQLEEAKRKHEEAMNGKSLPASEAVALGGANSAYQALGDAGKVFEANQNISGPFQGMLSRGMAKFEIGDTGKRAKSFDAQMKSNAQTIGKSLEGGKLTDQDIERYKDMLPNLNDSPEAAKDKIAILQNMIAQRQKADAAALGQAGYNVKNIQTSEMQQNPNMVKASGISPEDAQAELIRRKGIGAMLPKKPGRN